MTSKVQEHSDIENNNSFTELKSILVKPDEKKNARVAEIAVRVVCFLFLFIFIFPMIFCDYYFAMNNDSCVKQPLHISLTIYDYLIVNAIFGSIVVVGILFLFMYCDSETADKLKDNCLFIILLHLVRLFGISWIVVGAVMYWGEMNRTLCSQQTNDYLTASLIIRIIMTSFEVNHSYNKRNN
jgi:hypothetical protein